MGSERLSPSEAREYQGLKDRSFENRYRAGGSAGLRFLIVVVPVVGLAILAAACGGNSKEVSPTATATPTPEASSTPSATIAPALKCETIEPQIVDPMDSNYLANFVNVKLREGASQDTIFDELEANEACISELVTDEQLEVHVPQGRRDGLIEDLRADMDVESAVPGQSGNTVSTSDEN